MSSNTYHAVTCDHAECDAALLGAYGESLHAIRFRARQASWTSHRTAPRDLCPEHADTGQPLHYHRPKATA